MKKHCVVKSTVNCFKMYHPPILKKKSWWKLYVFKIQNAIASSNELSTEQKISRIPFKNSVIFIHRANTRLKNSKSESAPPRADQVLVRNPENSVRLSILVPFQPLSMKGRIVPQLCEEIKLNSQVHNVLLGIKLPLFSKTKKKSTEFFDCQNEL